LAIVLSDLLRFTAFDCPIGIFWPLCCLTFFYWQLLITPLVFSNFSLTHYGHYFSSYLFLIVDVYRR